MFETPYRYVFPTPPKLKGKLNKYNRLYAFPSIPEPPTEDGFVILDSGAFGLSLQGKVMDNAHMQKLSNHYALYPAKNYIKVAPDVFKSIRKTIENYKFWHKQGYTPVSPVLQFEDKKKITQYELETQLDFYASRQELDFVLVSNPDCTAAMLKAQNFTKNLLRMKERYNIKWFHFLGAGWNVDDCTLYSEMISQNALDSIDTIAYYNCAHSDMQNLKDWKIAKGSFKANVQANVQLITQIMEKY